MSEITKIAFSKSKWHYEFAYKAILKRHLNPLVKQKHLISFIGSNFLAFIVFSKI